MKISLYKKDWSLGRNLQVNYQCECQSREYLMTLPTALKRAIRCIPKGYFKLVRYDENKVVTHVYSIKEAQRVLKLNKL
jgi:hypothetical protein